MNILEIKRLCKTYEDFQLDNVSFDLPKGYIMGFIGSNGAGKTTTLKGILNLISTDSGSVRILGKDFKKNELSLKQDIAFMVGDSSFYQRRKIGTIAGVASRFYTNWDYVVFNNFLKRFRISQDKSIRELSQGMRIKFSLALALSHNASLIILDEPTSGLDPVARDELLELFQELIEDGSKSILFSTHITGDLEKCADYITFIQNGKIIESAELGSMLGEYSIVSGSNLMLEPLKDRLIAYKVNSLGFSGLIETYKLGGNDSVKKKKPTLEDIMIYFAKQASEENKTNNNPDTLEKSEKSNIVGVYND